MPKLTTLVASLLIAGLLYLTLVAGIDGDRTLAAMKHLNALGWAAILGLSLFNYALRFVRWHVYMRWLGHHVSPLRHLLIYLSGFALTTTPGKAGEGVRALYLARLGVSYPHTLAVMFAERFLDKLQPIADDLSVRGAAQVDTHALDADEIDHHAAMLDAAEQALDGLDTVLVAYGTLPDQAACAASPHEAIQAWHTNALSVIALVTDVANRLEARGAGLIAVISSVAGDRGRASNYVYGSAKAGLNAYLDGLRHRLHGSGVQVLTVRPGLVDTPMTAGMDKGPLFAKPAKVGGDIFKAMNNRRAVLYTPGIWRWIMTIVRCVPPVIFHRTQL